MNPVTVTPKQAEIVYGIKVQTLANWRAKGRGPNFIRVEGKKILYSCSAFEKWLADHEQKTRD